MCHCWCGDVFTVRSSRHVKHYKILQTNGSNFFVEANHRFSSLVELVEYYRTNSLNNGDMLGNPCKRVRPPLILPKQEPKSPGFTTGSSNRTNPAHQLCSPSQRMSGSCQRRSFTWMRSWAVAVSLTSTGVTGKTSLTLPSRS